MHMPKSILVWLLLFLMAAMAQATEPSPNSGSNPGQELSSLDTRLQDLKKEILDLNRDLFLLEEELLFPANTQFIVFLSMDVGKLFALDSVQLRINDTVVANHLYTERELSALRRGGVQRFYMGNLPSGEHELVAFFVGKGPKERDYKRGTTIKIKKGSEPQFVELKIVDSTAKYQPKFSVKVWDQ